MTQTLPRGGRVLDLGCGSGVPITRFIYDAGFDVTGMDYAAPMIEMAKSTNPELRWEVQDMRSLGPTPLYDGIISWDAFFHLSIEEQRRVLPDMAKRIRAGGALLLTVGPSEGETTGTINKETVYHASLSPQEYQAILRSHGFEIVQFTPEDPKCRGRSVLLASGKTMT